MTYMIKKVWVIEEMCLRRDMSVSKITPKFLTELAGSKGLVVVVVVVVVLYFYLPAIEIKDEDNLERCIGVPIIIYSVLDGII